MTEKEDVMKQRMMKNYDTKIQSCILNDTHVSIHINHTEEQANVCQKDTPKFDLPAPNHQNNFISINMESNNKDDDEYAPDSIDSKDGSKGNKHNQSTSSNVFL